MEHRDDDDIAHGSNIMQLTQVQTVGQRRLARCWRCSGRERRGVKLTKAILRQLIMVAQSAAHAECSTKWRMLASHNDKLFLGGRERRRCVPCWWNSLAHRDEIWGGFIEPCHGNTMLVIGIYKQAWHDQTRASGQGERKGQGTGVGGAVCVGPCVDDLTLLCEDQAGLVGARAHEREGQVIGRGFRYFCKTNQDEGNENLLVIVFLLLLSR